MKKNIGSLIITGSFLGVVSMSMPVVATANGNSYKRIVNETCQFVDSAVVGAKICGSGGGEVPLVPKNGNKCFFLTDLTASNNNGSTPHLVRVIDGNTPGLTPASLVYTLPGTSTIVQDFQTPIVFKNVNGLHVYDYPTESNTVFVSVSGYYDNCPGYNTRP